MAPKLMVKMPGGWTVWDEQLDGEVVSFRARRGVIGQEFVYNVEYISTDHLGLRILSAHDHTVFEGSLVR